MGLDPALKRGLITTNNKRGHHRAANFTRVAVDGRAVLIQLPRLLTEEIDPTISEIPLGGLFSHDLQGLLAFAAHD